jgi:hypothetical protein
MATQSFFHMKNLRNQQGNDAAASQRNGIPNSNTPPEPFMDEFTRLEEKVFSENPSPRIPESPEEESLRLFLKTHIAHHKASPALIERIKSSILSGKA